MTDPFSSVFVLRCWLIAPIARSTTSSSCASCSATLLMSRNLAAGAQAKIHAFLQARKNKANIVRTLLNTGRRKVVFYRHTYFWRATNRGSMAEARKFGETVPELRSAARLQPDAEIIHYHLSNALEQMPRRSSEGLTEIRTPVTLDRDFVV